MPVLGVSSRSRHICMSNVDDTVWVLGCQYDADEQKAFSGSLEDGGINRGKYNGKDVVKRLGMSRHIESLFRFTYRRDLPCQSLTPYNSITSDAGWGCMLRAAQMMMGCTMRVNYLGKDWRLPTKNKEVVLRENADYCNIVRWFTDYPGYPHIYSLQHLLQCGMKYDKLPGEWYGPSTAAHVLRDLAHLHRLKYDGPLEVMVTQGDTIYITEAEDRCADLTLNSLDALLKECAARNIGNSLLQPGEASAEVETEKEPESDAVAASNVLSPSSREKMQRILHRPVPVPALESGRVSSPSSPFFDPLLRPPPSAVQPWACALLVLVPLRLGISSVNQEYHEEIKSFLRSPYSVGIIGGRPQHAIYFVGYKGDELLGLDPHTVFKNPPPDPSDAALSATHQAAFADYISQVHIREPKDLVRLGLDQLDPSMALGLFFRDRREFECFCEDTRQRQQQQQQRHRGNLFLPDAKQQGGGQKPTTPFSPLFVVQHSPPSAAVSLMYCSGSEDDALSSPRKAAGEEDVRDDEEYVFL